MSNAQHRDKPAVRHHSGQGWSSRHSPSTRQIMILISGTGGSVPAAFLLRI